MRRATLAILVVLAAGCASPQTPSPPEDDALAFTSTRVDTDGDGLTDAVNVTLLRAPAPIPREELAVTLDGERLDTSTLLDGPLWSPGRGILLPCPDGIHELRISIRGEVKRVLVEECGVPPPTVPPFFQSRTIDGDGNGRPDAVELVLVSGGPTSVDRLAARLGDRPVRLYEDPLKSRLATGDARNGTHLYTPCLAESSVLNLTWSGQRLPSLGIPACERFDPGVDAPVDASPLDVDGDGRQDGWNLTLGRSRDAPFPMERIEARWGNASARLNGSVALDPPPARLVEGQRLVATCPGDGEMQFDLRVNGSLVLRRLTTCEAAPGRPLLELTLEASDDRLDATLDVSRVGAVSLGNLTYPNGTPAGQGLWRVGETVELACPDARLELRYEGRLAFRGPAPC